MLGDSWIHQIPAYAGEWLPLLMFLCMLAIVYLLWRTLQVMPRVKPMHVEPGSRESVSLDDVAGVTEAKAELQEVIDFLRHPKRFEQLGAKVPKGILLYGPPGTGKTLLAKGVAGESGAKFYSQSASAFVEMFVGLGAARMRKLFEEARRNAPAIVFIDELDAVGAARTGQGFTREQDQTLNQLLVELDGFGSSDQVVVMGASNRLQDLDPALLRPGRFDRQMLVGPPDLSGREAILHVHTRGKPLASDVDLSQVARQTSGLTGADLANICNEAAIFAVYFDNVGGEVSAAVHARLSVGARIAICGQISQYNVDGPQPTFDPRALIVFRARMEGFLINDYATRFGEAVPRLAAWLASGELRYTEDVTEGLENAPAAFMRMLRGENRGKALVKV